ncbi:Acyl-CoA N-acyltransferase [Phaffia rhodozyma]|uniref:Acyl-CoA N-acyltransferase n=1 Tax=Phaffia rhodozyma TaxID=264483 RepID=A0A0F7SVH5_PHARH|nr:Acyl-CoA N-acyltransferase [Phaffia rhodozyma]
MISGLFVYQEFQGLGIGNAIMDTLENQDRTVFKAHVVTVSTAAVDQNGLDSQTRMWYQRRGYKQIKVVSLSSSPFYLRSIPDSRTKSIKLPLWTLTPHGLFWL